MEEIHKILLAILLGFGIGVWFQYLNILFWKKYAQKTQLSKKKVASNEVT